MRKENDWSRFHELFERFKEVPVQVRDALLRSLETASSEAEVSRLVAEHLQCWKADKCDREKMVGLAATDEEVIAGIEQMKEKGGKQLHMFFAELEDAARND